MIIYKILLGLVGLGVVVFIHELGHFLGARLVGIDVEAFSIGWGKPFLKKNSRKCVPLCAAFLRGFLPFLR